MKALRFGLALLLLTTQASASPLMERFLTIHDADVKLAVYKTQEANKIEIISSGNVLLTIEPVMDNRIDYELKKIESTLKEMTMEEFDGMFFDDVC